MVTTLSTFGRVFCWVCPHGFIGKYITKFGLKKQLPKVLANPFIGVFLLFLGWFRAYRDWETNKKGLEFDASYNLTNNLQIGGAYTYSHFKFDTFNESVRNGMVTNLVSRDGNYLPFIPQNQYSIFTAYHLANGLKTRLTARTYGSYYMDNANTQKYEGYDLITDLMIGYEKKNHNIQLNVNNLFDKYYAIEASKNTSGVESYKAATPRISMLTYTYKF